MSQEDECPYSHTVLVLEEEKRIMAFHNHGSEFETFSVCVQSQEQEFLGYTSLDFNKMYLVLSKFIDGRGCVCWTKETLCEAGVTIEEHGPNKLFRRLLRSSSEIYAGPKITSTWY